jgi:hypothetical protein
MSLTGKKNSIISDTAPTKCGTRITAAHSKRLTINIRLLSMTHILQPAVTGKVRYHTRKMCYDMPDRKLK